MNFLWKGFGCLLSRERICFRSFCFISDVYWLRASSNCRLNIWLLLNKSSFWVQDKVNQWINQYNVWACVVKPVMGPLLRVRLKATVWSVQRGYKWLEFYGRVEGREWMKGASEQTVGSWDYWAIIINPQSTSLASPAPHPTLLPFSMLCSPMQV